MKRNTSIKKKQLTIGAWAGFKKTVVHKDQTMNVEIPKVAVVEERTVKCQKCEKKFFNNQGLSVHLKCVHGSGIQNSDKTVFTIATTSTLSVTDIVKEEVKSVLNDLVKKVVAKDAKFRGGKETAGKKRCQYTAMFKANVINALDEPDATQETVADKFNISQSQVSRYVKNRSQIMKDAADSYRKKHRKGRKCRKYVRLYPALWDKFKKARAKGYRVDFHWLWSKARVLFRHQEKDETLIVGPHVIVRFLHDYKIRMRAKQRGKKQPKSAKIQDLQKWHATYRERCIRPRSTNNYDKKWGGFLPKQRLNVDQSPLPFVINSKKTYEFVEKGEKYHNTWISQPGSGLDKRQCTLQVMFRPEGNQPRLAIIFRGKGRVTMDEKLAWYPNVDVFFQENAWVDGEVCKKWIDSTLKNFIEEEHLDRFVLLLDNLSSQQSDAFKEKVAELKGLCWYGLKDATDLWQPVDAGYAQVLKQLVATQQREWLDVDDNADKWYDGDSFTAKERRILITEWAGKAWEKLSEPKYDNLRNSCWTKTGCLMTADGSDDNFIKPEGLPDYNVPPPSVCDPISQPQPQPQNQPLIELTNDNDGVNEEEEEESLDMELVEEDDGDGNIFDMLDQFFV